MIGKDVKKVVKKVTLKEGKADSEWVVTACKGGLCGLVEIPSCLVCNPFVESGSWNT